MSARRCSGLVLSICGFVCAGGMRYIIPGSIRRSASPPKSILRTVGYPPLGVDKYQIRAAPYKLGDELLSRLKASSSSRLSSFDAEHALPLRLAD